MTNRDLALKLAAFRIDHGSPRLTFAQRLAHENRWDDVRAQRVVREYLRFVYLAAVSDGPVTPSVAVDQAWHLHLCYTHSDWTELCGGVLGRPLHHGPTQGGEAEDARYVNQYEHTRGLYEREFGECPPADIWPPAEIRFAAAGNPFWVSRDRFIVFDRKKVGKVTLLSGLVVASVLAAGVMGTAEIASLIGACLLFGFLLFFGLKSKRKRDRRGGCGAGGCSTSSHSGCGGDAGGGCGGGD